MVSGGVVALIVVGVVASVSFLVYLCCFRRQVTIRQTQKLMDATNLIHAQEPHGTMSPELLPDGSMGLLVRPLPSMAASISMPDHIPQPICPVYQSSIPLSVNLPYNPEHVDAAVSQLAFAAPSAPPGSFPSHVLDIQFSSHPRPGVVTTWSDEVKGQEMEEVKGDEGLQQQWEPTPFVPPSRAPESNTVSATSTSILGYTFSAGSSRSGSAGTSAIWPASGLVTTAPSSPQILIHSQPGVAPQSVSFNNTSTIRESPVSSSVLSTPSPSASTSSSGTRKYPEMDPSMMPPRQQQGPHEIINHPSTSRPQDHHMHP